MMILIREHIFVIRFVIYNTIAGMLSIANASKAHWGQGVEKHFNQFFLPNLHCVIISEMSPVGAISVLQIFLSTLRSGRHRADVHRTSCALIFALMRVQ